MASRSARYRAYHSRVTSPASSRLPSPKERASASATAPNRMAKAVVTMSEAIPSSCSAMNTASTTTIHRPTRASVGPPCTPPAEAMISPPVNRPNTMPTIRITMADMSDGMYPTSSAKTDASDSMPNALAATMITANITNQKSSLPMTRVGLKCEPVRSTASSTPPRSSHWLRRTFRSRRSAPFSSSFASK